MWNLQFTGNLNTSIQIGDSIFTSGGSTESEEGFDITDYANATTNMYGSDISYVGTVNNITISGSGYTIEVDNATGAIPPAADSYIFFSKNQDVNVSSVKGYYNAIKFKNNSKTKAELFAVSCSITASSK